MSDTSRETSPETFREQLQDMLNGISYVRRHDMIVEDVGDVVRVRMPTSPDNANITGTLHASALFCVAETAAGVAAWCIKRDPDTMVLVRDVEVRYPRPGNGEVVAAARVGAVGGGDATVAVTVTDRANETVLGATFTYAIRRASGSPRTPRA